MTRRGDAVGWPRRSSGADLRGCGPMSEQRTGKATAELFEQVILRRLGRDG